MLRSVVLVVAVAGCGDNLIPERTARISGNESASCVIDETGALYCWGHFNGPLDDVAVGERGDRTTGLPARFGAELWNDVAVGSSHACGVREDGTLWCWGRNCGGQLGDGTRESRAEPIEPVEIAAGASWVHVATGGGHSCAIDSAGQLSCWGGLDYGQRDCATIPTQPPTQHDGTWLAVSSGWYSTHGLRDDGTLWRWRDHELDSDPVEPFELPAQLGTSRWRSIASGLDGVYGVRDDGSLAFAQFDADVETQIGTDTDWGDAIAARDHACALKQGGALWCWGRNDMGQLGTGLPSELVTEPAQLGTVTGWTGVSAGLASSCGVYDGQVYCWGANAAGEIGIGMPYSRDIHTPQHIGVDLELATR